MPKQAGWEKRDTVAPTQKAPLVRGRAGLFAGLGCAPLARGRASAMALASTFAASTFAANTLAASTLAARTDADQLMPISNSSPFDVTMLNGLIPRSMIAA